MKNDRKGNGLGCLVMLLLVWLLFFGGCEKLERLVDTQIAANEKKLEQPAQQSAPQSEAVERVRAEDVASISPNLK